jgi:hypothetical protein
VSEEVEHEPIPGLPEALPPGERILWQGQPDWRSLARHAFQVRILTGYFAVFALARGAFALADGAGIGSALLSSLVVVPLAAFALAVLTLLAWLNARSTMYTITTRRIVMRFGVALPMSFNLPFKQLGAANLNERRAGDGDIAVQLTGSDRLAWLVLWPHARPWRFTRAQPMLRSIPEVRKVAALLGEAVREWSTTEGGLSSTGSRGPIGPGSARSGRADGPELSLARGLLTTEGTAP